MSGEPKFRLDAPWHWIRRGGLWAAQDHRGTCVRPWSATDFTRMVTMPRIGTRAVPLSVYVAVSAANDPLLGRQPSTSERIP